MLWSFGKRICFASLCMVTLSGMAPASLRDPSSDAAVAKAQLEVARQIHRQATLIVAVAPQSVTPEEPNAPPFYKQNYTVIGKVSHCFKGGAKPPARISYIITSEGRPKALEKPHVAFLRKMSGRWAAVDGPMFRDSAPMRAGLTKFTTGCSR